MLIGEAEQAFNEQLRMLFTKKLKVEMVICQEDLKILRLQWGLMFEQALETSDRQLMAAIEHKKQLKVMPYHPSYLMSVLRLDMYNGIWTNLCYISKF